VPASERIEEEHEQSHYYRPSFKSAINKIAYGGVYYLASDMAYSYCNANHNPFGQGASEIGLAFGYKLVADGVLEAVHWGYHSFKNHCYRTYNSKNLSRQKKRSTEDIRPLSIQYQDEFVWNKTCNIARLCEQNYLNHMNTETKCRKAKNEEAVLSNLEKTLLKCLIFPKKHSMRCRSL
jgi:hypothetical protein